VNHPRLPGSLGVVHCEPLSFPRRNRSYDVQTLAISFGFDRGKEIRSGRQFIGKEFQVALERARIDLDSLFGFSVNSTHDRSLSRFPQHCHDSSPNHTAQGNLPLPKNGLAQHLADPTTVFCRGGDPLNMLYSTEIERFIPPFLKIKHVVTSENFHQVSCQVSQIFAQKTSYFSAINP
jgi:hypothetical protein